MIMHALHAKLAFPEEKPLADVQRFAFRPLNAVVGVVVVADHGSRVFGACVASPYQHVDVAVGQMIQQMALKI
jgi:hypothetical protein